MAGGTYQQPLALTAFVSFSDVLIPIHYLLLASVRASKTTKEKGGSVAIIVIKKDRSQDAMVDRSILSKNLIVVPSVS